MNKKADMTLQNLTYLILFIVLFGSLTFGAANKLSAAIIKQGITDFSSLDELIETVYSSEISTTLGVPFILEEGTALLVFNEKNSITFGYGGTTTHPEITITNDGELSGKKTTLCLCRKLEKIGEDSFNFACKNSICHGYDFDIFFNTQLCSPSTAGNCVLGEGAKKVHIYALEIEPINKERADIYAEKNSDNSVTIFDKAKA